ncbi:MAG: SH3 domain-containing protein [Polyangiales bacterium]
MASTLASFVVLTSMTASMGACSSGGTASPGQPSDSAAVDGGSLGETGSIVDSTTGEAAEPVTPDNAPDAAPATDPDAASTIAVGGKARTRTNLNLRDGVGTSHAVLTVMPCGSTVDVVGGPTSGWWNVTYSGTTGWASGTYLVAPADFLASDCGGGSVDAAGIDASGSDGAVASLSPTQAQVIALAQSGVGYSYYWGHGSWGTDGKNPGSCSGSCPSCTHSGAYGADCSGFVAKVWQVPSPSPVTEDLHPYSTYDFVNSTVHWSVIDRSTIKAGDALTYNNGTEGHIMLFESGSDPWGNIWTYEARGCATGIVHNLRVADTTYIAIRREGM